MYFWRKVTGAASDAPRRQPQPQHEVDDDADTTRATASTARCGRTDSGSADNDVSNGGGVVTAAVAAAQCTTLIMRKLSVDMDAHSRCASDVTGAVSFAGAGLTPAPTRPDAMTSLCRVASPHDTVDAHACTHGRRHDNDNDDEDDEHEGAARGGSADVCITPVQLQTPQRASRALLSSPPCRSPSDVASSDATSAPNVVADGDGGSFAVAAAAVCSDDCSFSTTPTPSPPTSMLPLQTAALPTTATATTVATSSQPRRQSMASASVTTATLSASRRDHADAHDTATTTTMMYAASPIDNAATTAAATDAAAVMCVAAVDGAPPSPSPPPSARSSATTRKPPRALRFKLIRELGAGASGTVYLAQLHSGTLVAVKALRHDRNDADRIDREVTIMSRLPPHPNCVRYYGARRGRRHHYIIMESVSGGSIAATRRATGPFSECALRRYAREVLLGLVHLHTHGIVHRDIKGANILLDDTGHAKIGDFGCCRDTTQLQRSWRGGGGGGTPRWMAPELCRGEAATLKSDVWSFGCLCLEMVNDSGVPWEAFAPHTPLERVVFEIGHATRPPPVPQHLSPAARDFVAACLHIDPAARASTIALLDHVFLALDTLDTGDDDDDDDDAYHDDDDDAYNATSTCALSMVASLAKPRPMTATATTTHTVMTSSSTSTPPHNNSGCNSNNSSSSAGQRGAGADAMATHKSTTAASRASAMPVAATDGVALILHSGPHASSGLPAAAAAAAGTPSTGNSHNDYHWLACPLQQQPQQQQQQQQQHTLSCSRRGSDEDGGNRMSATSDAATRGSTHAAASTTLHDTAHQEQEHAATSIVCAAPLRLFDSQMSHA